MSMTRPFLTISGIGNSGGILLAFLAVSFSGDTSTLEDRSVLDRLRA